MDLVFGCKLTRKGESEYRCINDIAFGGDNTKCWINSVPFGAMPLELEKDLIQNGGEFEIIGRDIQLADVLIILIKRQKEPEQEGYIWNMNKKTLKLLEVWDMFNPLHLQSEETISFIYDLIVNTDMQNIIDNSSYTDKIKENSTSCKHENTKDTFIPSTGADTSIGRKYKICEDCGARWEIFEYQT